jgi:MoaA/NifB/PqqE/SkfB family radical SAM enzyme
MQQPIDTDWLKNNPGQLFNNPTITQERQDMLDNKPVASCAKSCWIPESQNIPSRRTMFPIESAREFTGTQSRPEVVEVILGSDCNMTCAYCSKRFSSAWLRDIKETGPYIDNYTVDDRFNITIDDKVILKLSQNELNTSGRYQTILNEVSKFSKLKTLKLMGGEPFLYNSMQDILRFVSADTIEITTGLGVNPKRFERMLGSIPRDQTTLVISAESTRENYEFVRNGNTYSNFLHNLKIIQQHGVKYRYGITLSNLNIHDFKRFQDELATDDDYFNVLVDPVFLSPGLVDPETKERILATSFKYNEKEIHQAVSAGYTDEQYKHFKQYVVEFAKRRNLTLDIFPESFKKWILE